jgi:phenylacetate-CoA ligase
MEVQTSEVMSPKLDANAFHYDALRRRHISDLLSRMPENVKRVKWPAERIREERQQRLRSLIHVAKEKSSWHRERLKEIDADSFTEADLDKLPVMTKADLMANFDEIITDKNLTLEKVNEYVSHLREDGYLLDKYHVIASGGTSGFRGVFVYDWDGWTTLVLSIRNAFLPVNLLLWRLLSFRPMGNVFVNSRMRKKKARKPQSQVQSVAVFADIASHMSHAMANSLAYPFMDQEFPATLSIREIVDGLNSAQPESLSGYPSVLYRLTLEAKSGRLNISPKRISSGGEPLFPYIRQAVRDIWGPTVTNFWATSEGGTLAWSCGQGEGMHLNEDLQIIEPVDDYGRPVGPGVRGSKIYLTNLFNHVLPIIRYEISDQVTLLRAESCPCGSTLHRVEDIQGRQDDAFIYEGGVIVHPVVFWSAFERYPSVVEYQVKQTEHGVAIYLLTNGPVALEQVERDVAEYLEKSGLDNPEVSAKIVDKLERTPGVAKLKRFVPLASTRAEMASRPSFAA